MGLQRALQLLNCIGLLCLIFNSATNVRAEKLAKRATSARITTSRNFGGSTKHHSSSSNGNNFDCPEEFGYYPHPTDCSQYYVCVFGGALLESCTGGLMYSHELQTCDWPRNVGCEVVDSGSSASTNSNGQREASGRSIKQQSGLSQHVPSRVRFGSAFTSPAAGSTSTSASYNQPRPTVPQQYHRQPPQTIQAQVQTIPPPIVPQNSGITSRGEAKALLDSQEDIAQLYADAHDTLPPVEEEETDRQQRVYRGQPSTVSQVQRDRDGIVHQASLNAIPNHGKIGSFAFGSQYRVSFKDADFFDKSLSRQAKTLDKTVNSKQHRRWKRELNETTTATTASSLIEESSNSPTTLESDKTTSSNDSNPLSKNSIETLTTEISEAETSGPKDILNFEDVDSEDTQPSESIRLTRQLRAYARARAKWPQYVNSNYRSIDSSPYQQQPSYSLGQYNPYLSPPTKSNFNQLSLGYQPYQTIHHHPNNQILKQQPSYALPTSHIEDDFRPIAGNYFNGAASTTTPRPNYFKNPDLLPYLLQSLKDYKEFRKNQQQTDSFSYFHLENPPVIASPKPILQVHSTKAPPQKSQPQQFYQQANPQRQVEQPNQKVTPSSHYAGYSTVGGFYNNQAAHHLQTNTETSFKLDFKPTVSPAKLVSHYSISDGQGLNNRPTTESNYFQYNILTNQKMKAFYSTVNPLYKDIAQYKYTTQRPPTSNINIVAAPNLVTARPIQLQRIPPGPTYTNTSSYQAIAKGVASTVSPLKVKSVPATFPYLKPQINLQFSIPEFVASLQASDLANLNPAVTNMLKYFKQIGVSQQTNHQQSQNPYPIEGDYEDEIIESTTERTRLQTKNPTTYTSPSSTSSTRRPIKGYESFINSLPNKHVPPAIKTTTTVKYNNQHSFLNQGEEYYDEYDEEEEVESDEEIRPPSDMPPFMPMSETMPPPRSQIPTPSPTVPSNANRPHYVTGYMDATTTRRPYFSGTNVQQFYQPSKNSTTNGPPPFIRFPTDIFQEIKHRFPQFIHETSTKLSTTTRTPFSTITSKTTPTTTPKTTTTTSRVRYTVRPNRNRGQNKWQELNNGVSTSKNRFTDTNANKTEAKFLPSKKRPNTAAMTAALGAYANKLNSDTDSYRIESSSTSSSSSSLQSQQSPKAANLYVQQPSRPTKLIIETIPPSSVNGNRNYYNTSSQTYNHAGYEPQLQHHNHNQQQGQQHSITLLNQQQQQQQDNQQPEQGSYENYYSVYDDDIDLYRDIEYQQQSPPPQQYQSQQPIRQQQHSTYRPLEILTTPAPVQQAPARETSYNNRAQQQSPSPLEKPNYSNQQSLIYNTDYDEDLLAQIEQDNSYDQPTRTPVRTEQVTIRTLDSAFRFSPTSRSKTILNDARHYYRTVNTEPLTTTEAPRTELPTSISDDTSDEYNEQITDNAITTERPLYQQPTRYTTNTLRLISTQESDEYSVIDDSTTHSRATTEPITFTTNTVRPTTKTATNPTPKFVGSSRATPQTRPISTSTFSTSRRTTPTTVKTTTTPKSVAKLVRTTATPTTTSTSKAPRSKSHANKSHKNQPQKSRLKSPRATNTTTTTNTTPPFIPTTTTKDPPKFTTTQRIQSYPAISIPDTVFPIQNANRDTQTTLRNDLRQSHSSRFNLQSVDDVETISDASQTVQVKATESKSGNTFEPYASVYGTSSRGNSVRSNTEKPYRGSVLYDDYNSKESGEYYNNKNSAEKSIKFSEKQRKRIQSFILSDVEPRSFKPAPTPRTTTSTEQSSERRNIDSSSSTSTLRYSTIGVGVESPKPFKYSLESGSNGFSLRVQNHPLSEAVESVETVKPIYERPTAYSTSSTPYTPPQTSTKSTPVTEFIFLEPRVVDIKPTTYAPPLRNWRNGRTTNPTEPSENVSSQQFEYGDHLSSSGSEHNAETAEKVSTTTPKPSTTSTVSPPTTERPVQSFTTRASYFKDALIRATGSPAQRFVSPYKSLETILQEASRTTSRPRYNNPGVSSSPPILPTTSRPKGTYFLITTPPRNLSNSLTGSSVTGSTRNYSVSDTILSTFSTATVRPPIPFTTTKPTTTTTRTTTSTREPSIPVTVVVTVPLRIATTPTTTTTSPKTSSSEDFSSSENSRSRGRSRYTAATGAGSDEPTTYAPKSYNFSKHSPLPSHLYRRKLQRARISALQRQRNDPNSKSREKLQAYKLSNENSAYYSPKSKSINRKPIENESFDISPRAEALVALPIDSKQDNSIESSRIPESSDSSGSTESEKVITDRPFKYLFSNKYRQQTSEQTLAESLQNAGYIKSIPGRTNKFHPSAVLEQLQLFLAGESDESSAQHFVNDFTQPEIRAAVEEIKNLYTTSTTTSTTPTPPPTTTTTTTLRTTTTATPSPTTPYTPTTTTISSHTQRYTTATPTSTPSTSTQYFPKFPSSPSSSSTTTLLSVPMPSPTPPTAAAAAAVVVGAQIGRSTSSAAFKSPIPIPVRASRVNNAIKSSIAAASSAAAGAARSNKVSALSTSSQSGAAAAAAAVKCSDNTSNAKCNEIPSRTNSNNRNRGGSHYANQDRDTPVSTNVNNNRGTHPPRTRPTLKPSGTIVSKAQEFVDIYRYPPSRPEPLYPQPTPDKTAAKCRRDVCLLPDCSCGGREIPGDLPVENVPQIVLLTFDDSVNDLNKQLYIDLFEKGRVNPNGCPITATFYVSHEWTDYSQVQNLYADGHEMASHTISHSFGEQFSQKKWTREIAGQREILAAYGGVKLSDVRGMRAPFLSVGGNKMYKMLYDSNFTYDSSMPVYENRPPSWPYTLDYKIFHDCMIPPCPTRSYPGVWQVPMVMWQDLNGGRCSMGDACSNPSDADGVYKMIMKNFERHYTTNRAPFGLFYHAAWFTQPHHKEAFIKFLDAINAMPDVWIVTNWQMLQWVRDPTPISRINSFQPFQCDYSDRPKRCNNPKVCNLWHKSGVRYMKTCQPCPDIYPWTGKTGIRSSRIDNDTEDST